MEVREIIELMKAVSENSLTDFELKQDDIRLRIKRENARGAGTELLSGAAIPAFGTAVPAPGAVIPALGAADAGAVQNTPGISTDQIITCPLVGTFYSSPAPDAERFVKAGDTVKKGQVVGIVEAMKLMNEIESEYDGIVEAVLVKDGETVEYGQPLFRIR